MHQQEMAYEALELEVARQFMSYEEFYNTPNVDGSYPLGGLAFETGSK